MPDIGNTLREARIRRGLTLADVENVTKIRSKYVEALEENDFEVLPGPTVVKGFLRSYALFLRLPADPLIEEYRALYESSRDDIGALRTELSQQRRTQTSAERKKKRQRRTQRGYIAVAILAVIVIVVIAWLGAGRGKGAAVLGADNLPSTTAAVSTSSTVATEGGETSTSEDVESSTSEDSSTSTTGKTTTTTVSETTTTAGNGTASTSGQNVTMVLTVTEGSCWLVVRDDSENGADLYAGTLSAGGQQTFNTAKRYWFRAGIPDALSITVNGTPYTVSGGAGTFVVTEAGVEREQTGSTDSTG